MDRNKLSREEKRSLALRVVKARKLFPLLPRLEQEDREQEEVLRLLEMGSEDYASVRVLSR